MNMDDFMDLLEPDIEDLIELENVETDIEIEDVLDLLDTLELLYDIQEFYNRFYVYINQVFGALNFREDILKLFNLPKGAVFYETHADDARGGTWGHHLAVNLKTKKKVCSTNDLGQQDIDTEDTACQVYSIYNTLILNRDRILKDKKVSQDVKDFVKSLKELENVMKIKRYSNKRLKLFNPDRIKAVMRNTKKMVELLLWILKDNTIQNLVDNEYIWYRNPDKPKSKKFADDYITEGSGLHVTNMTEKLRDSLEDWKEYGFMFFL